MKKWNCLAALLLCLSGLRIAAADIAPDPGWVESCTMEKVHFNGNECFECRNSHEGPPADAGDLGVADGICLGESAYGPEGYAFVCNTRGASVWTEIWCREAPGATGPAGDRKESDHGNCAVWTPGKDPHPGILFDLLYLLFKP